MYMMELKQGLMGQISGPNACIYHAQLPSLSQPVPVPSCRNFLQSVDKQEQTEAWCTERSV